MNSKPGRDRSSTAYDTRIDAALHHYGGAMPEPGLESRVASRIAAVPRQSFKSSSFGLRSRPWLVLLRGVSVGALAAAVACAIVLGTLRHSQRIAIPQATRTTQTGAMDGAHGEHIPTHAVPQSATIDPAAPRTAPRSRAVVSNNPGGKQSAGAVPRSPYPPGQQQPSAPQQ